MSLPGYDEWKTHDPRDDAPTCHRCGGWLTFAWDEGYLCQACDEEDYQRQRQADDKPTLIDLEDSEFLSGGRK